MVWFLSRARQPRHFMSLRGMCSFITVWDVPFSRVNCSFKCNVCENHKTISWHKQQDETCPYHYCQLLHVKVSQDTGQRLKPKCHSVTYAAVCLHCFGISTFSLRVQCYLHTLCKWSEKKSVNFDLKQILLTNICGHTCRNEPDYVG